MASDWLLSPEEDMWMGSEEPPDVRIHRKMRHIQTYPEITDQLHQGPAWRVLHFSQITY